MTAAQPRHIGTLKDKINSYTTWDDRNHAGRCGVHSIADWDVNDWRRLFVSQLGVAHSPVQLHPRLGADTTSYYAKDTPAKVRQANLANRAQRNIAY